MHLFFDRSGRIRDTVRLKGDVFLIDQPNDCLVYAPLKRVAFFTGLPYDVSLASACALRPAGCREKDIYTLVQSLKDPAGRLKPEAESRSRAPFQPTDVTLFLTNACNMVCVYCYAAGEPHVGHEMSLDLAERSVDFVLRNCRATGTHETTLAFHGGGEPTLAWEMLTAAYVYAASQAASFGISLRATMATNGILSPQQLTWIARNMTEICVSFDGTPERQSCNRPLLSGKDSTEYVLRTLHFLDEAQLSYCIRVTLTAISPKTVSEAIHFLCQRFKPEQIILEPVYSLGRWSQRGVAGMRDFAEVFRVAKGIAQEYGQTVTFSAARFPAVSLHFCGACRDNFCVTPDGCVSACYMALDAESPLAGRFIYGHYDYRLGDFVIDKNRLEWLRKQTVDSRGECRECYAKWQCSGYCLYQQQAGSYCGKNNKKDLCDAIRHIVSDSILMCMRTGKCILKSPSGISVMTFDMGTGLQP